MNEQLIERLKANNNHQNLKIQYDLYRDIFNIYNNESKNYVKNSVTFYYYMKNEEAMKNYIAPLKDSFTGYLKGYYYNQERLEKDFDTITNSGEDYLDTFIDLSSDDLSQRLADIAKEKAKKDSNYLGLYNKVSEMVKKYNKNANIDYSFLNGFLNDNNADKKDYNIENAILGVQDALNDVNNVALVEEPELKDDIQESFDDRVKKAEEKINSVESNTDFQSAQSEIDKRVNQFQEKINKMVDDAKIDPNLGYEAINSNDEVDHTEKGDSKDNVDLGSFGRPNINSNADLGSFGRPNINSNADLGSFGRPNINSNADYKNASADIKSKIEALNMEQRALEKANQKRIDEMVGQKASELGVSKENLEKYMDKNDISINEIDKIVISPTMENQVAANEAVAQLPKTSFTRLVDRLFAKLKLKNSDLEIEEKENESVLNISLDTSKAQKISSMEKKIYDKLIRSSQRRKKVSKWIVDTKNNVKNAIKNVFSKLKDTDTKNKERFSNKLHEVADKIYTPENKQTNNEYEVSVFDLLNKLNEKQIIGKEGSQVGEIENPDLEIEKSAKTM